MAWGRGLLVACLCATAFACAREAVPLDLIGTWTTNDARYAGRSLEIGAETLAFGAEGTRTTYRMQGIERVVEEGTGETVFHLYYDHAGDAERELRVRTPQPGLLRLDNHSEVWTRSGAASAGG
jgi:hypothetical protein